jgi:putative Mn2+ efflux pump MntP
MSPITIAIIAFSMSVDAFAVSVGRGAAMERPPLREALRCGFVFGLVEAITPLIGWLAGVAASRFVQAVDHWIAFALLAAVGLHMLYAALWQKEEHKAIASSLPVLIMTAIGTSLDAMAIGVSLAFLEANILIIAAAIGFATFVMSSGGMMLGRVIGERLGKIAEIVAGIALIAIGANILMQHLAQ